jgi:hypothetical protein
MFKRLGLAALLAAAVTFTPLAAQGKWVYIGPPAYAPYGPYFPRYFYGYYPGPYSGFYYPGYAYPGSYSHWYYYHEHHEHHEHHHRHK